MQEPETVVLEARGIPLGRSSSTLEAVFRPLGMTPRILADSIEYVKPNLVLVEAERLGHTLAPMISLMAWMLPLPLPPPPATILMSSVTTNDRDTRATVGRKVTKTTDEPAQLSEK